MFDYLRRAGDIKSGQIGKDEQNGKQGTNRSSNAGRATSRGRGENPIARRVRSASPVRAPTQYRLRKTDGTFDGIRAIRNG